MTQQVAVVHHKNIVFMFLCFFKLEYTLIYVQTKITTAKSTVQMKASKTLMK